MTKGFIKAYSSPRQFGLMRIFEYAEGPHHAQCYNGLSDTFNTFEIDNHQISQLLVWMGGDYLIQEVAPSLTASQREMCISGMSDEAFEAACGEDQ